jgi:ssRNA-specific RNase YbeY (16S rRNA maturation enzyme)
MEDEALRYVVHGLLHLLGHDDATAAGRAAMRRLEDRYLRGGAWEGEEE